MKSKKSAFTIVELLTVMSIIIILMGLVLPALNKVRRYATTVKQHGQFNSISVAIDLFRGDMDGYPPSALSDTPDYYGGAHKLCEALMGQDLVGFHPRSRWRSDGTDNQSNVLYPQMLDVTVTPDEANLRARKGPYIEMGNANIYRNADIYVNCGSFDPCNYVLCDVYSTVDNLAPTGKSKIGMPILYYRADETKLSHDPNNLPGNPNTTHIYNYTDNYDLIRLGAPFYGTPSATDHPMNSGDIFYQKTIDRRITTIVQYRPHRPDSYILIAAGFDGLYGTDDDICNFTDK